MYEFALQGPSGDFHVHPFIELHMMMIIRMKMVISFLFLIPTFSFQKIRDPLWVSKPSQSLQVPQRGGQHFRPNCVILRMSRFDDDKPTLSLKVVGVALVGIVGIFGVSLAGLQSTLRDVARQEQIPASAKLKSSVDGETSVRGAMTKLTKRELNAKLAQLPVFLVVDDSNGGIVTKDGTGFIYLNKGDADAYSKQNSGCTVTATSLDEIYLSLVAKKVKSSVVGGIVAKSDFSAQYRFVPTKSSLNDVPSEWRGTHSDNDVPLFRVQKMAFEDPQGLILPLFTNKADAITSYERMQASKTEKTTDSRTPEIQTTSLLDIIDLFNTGGFESRALEIFPDMQSIETARAMMNDVRGQ